MSTQHEVRNGKTRWLPSSQWGRNLIIAGAAAIVAFAGGYVLNQQVTSSQSEQVARESKQRDYAICVKGNTIRMRLSDYVNAQPKLVVPPQPPGIDQVTVNYIFAILASANSQGEQNKQNLLSALKPDSCVKP